MAEAPEAALPGGQTHGGFAGRLLDDMVPGGRRPWGVRTQNFPGDGASAASSPGAQAGPRAGPPGLVWQATPPRAGAH